MSGSHELYKIMLLIREQPLSNRRFTSQQEIPLIISHAVISRTALSTNGHGMLVSVCWLALIQLEFSLVSKILLLKTGWSAR